MDYPKLLGETESLQIRLQQLADTHIAPLTQFVHRLRERMGTDASIPYIDPWDGGIDAEVMFLLEAPGPKARNSGFVSMNNPDETAKNLFVICHEAGIERKRLILWNTVPWYIGTGSRIRAANASDIAEGVGSLGELLLLLPKLRAIVLVGGKAQKTALHIQKTAPHLKIYTSPHPSPMFVNRKPENRERILGSWKTVQAFLTAQKV